MNSLKLSGRGVAQRTPLFSSHFIRRSPPLARPDARSFVRSAVVGERSGQHTWLGESIERNHATEKIIWRPRDIEIASPKSYEISSFWLRDSCRCSRCVDPSTQQKLFLTADIPHNITAESTKELPDGSLQVCWKNDIDGYPSHESIYPKSFLYYHLPQNYPKPDTHLHLAEPWTPKKIDTEVQFLDYEAYAHDDSILFEAVQQLVRHGLVFIKNVPESEESVEKIANRIGNLRETFYGRTWNVKSVPQAKNIAYTNVFLGLHMDLLYMKEPPGFQLLHCIKNSQAGGASLFADSFHATKVLKEQDKSLYDHLTTYKTPYHYQNDGKSYYSEKPTFELSQVGGEELLTFVNYSPPFQAPFTYQIGDDAGAEAFRKYVKAAAAFAKILEENLWRYKMKEGECVIFNNRRALHGRDQFTVEESGDGQGMRWLKGAYLDSQTFDSRWRGLRKDFGQTEEGKKVVFRA